MSVDKDIYSKELPSKQLSLPTSAGFGPGMQVLALSTQHIQCWSNPKGELWIFQACRLIWWNHIYGAIMPFHFCPLPLLTNNKAANFCQLWEILRCECLSIRMCTENIEEWSFKRQCFEEKERNTHIISWQFVKYQAKGKSSQLPGAGTVKVASFQALNLIYCSQNLSHPILLWQTV